MDIKDKRFLVAGATGVLGGELARRLAAGGATLAVAGHDADALELIAKELGARAIALDLTDAASARACPQQAADALGGLDGIVLATGVVAFGPAGSLDDEVVRTLFAVNALGPIALLSAALPLLGSNGAVVALTAMVADNPTAEIAEFSATKAALSAWLQALRHEKRREERFVVLDVRPRHVDTGFADRPLAGSPPALPDASDPGDVAERIVDALREDRRVLAYDLGEGRLVAG